MKRTLLLLLFIPFFAVSQKGHKDTTLVYLDENLNFTNAKNGAFAGLSIKVENGWLVYVQYPDTTPLLKAYFKDKNLTVKEGPYTAYYPKKIKAREGFYYNDKMNGNWRYWYPDGQLKDSGRLADDHLVGLWKSWHPNGNLSSESFFKEELTPVEINAAFIAHSGAPPPVSGIRTGSYTSWYMNGQKEAVGPFNENKMDGDWHWYHPNGARSTMETYTKGTVTNLQCFDSTGKASPDLCSIEAPALLKLYGDYRKFLYQNLNWPEEARKKKIEGDVRVRFQVSREGKLQNLTIQSNQPVLQKAVAEFFGQMQEWYPAVSHNRIVVWEDEITIPFRIGNYFKRPAQQDTDW